MHYQIQQIDILNGGTVTTELCVLPGSTPLVAVDGKMQELAKDLFGEHMRHRRDGSLLGYYAHLLTGICIICNLKNED
jgi:hypothetical protein